MHASNQQWKSCWLMTEWQYSRSGTRIDSCKRNSGLIWYLIRTSFGSGDELKQEHILGSSPAAVEAEVAQVTRLSEDTFPRRQRTVISKLAHWSSALPLPASRKQTHLTSHVQYKAQSAEVPSHSSPSWLWNSLSATSGPCALGLHTQSPPPRMFPSCGSLTWCCLTQGNEGSLQDLGRRNSLGEGLVDQQSLMARQALWWSGLPGAEQPHSQPEAHTSPNLPQCEF